MKLRKVVIVDGKVSSKKCVKVVEKTQADMFDLGSAMTGCEGMDQHPMFSFLDKLTHEQKVFFMNKCSSGQSRLPGVSDDAGPYASSPDPSFWSKVVMGKPNNFLFPYLMP